VAITDGLLLQLPLQLLLLRNRK